MNRILRNVYYTGIVPFMGAYYEGDHDALVDISTWLRVQDVLHAHNRAGDKDREHAHYLKGSIFCGECGSRLIFSRNRGKMARPTTTTCASVATVSARRVRVSTSALWRSRRA